MTKREILDYCLTYPGAYEDYPFDGEWAALRHGANKKTFAFVYNHGGRLCVNLKCPPEEADFYRGVYRDVTPAYHMNKTHWNTVYLNGDVPEEELYALISMSYALTKPRPPKK